ncbi:hypothetical protein, partial [Bradyrhizobium sp. SZCCHNS3014]|uniref:hypothetical protein n=1 Tax=Bradyrhizobium sp. SZCCHNS3014 TaxID=3057317 RepID=UPI0029161842
MTAMKHEFRKTATDLFFTESSIHASLGRARQREPGIHPHDTHEGRDARGERLALHRRPGLWIP